MAGGGCELRPFHLHRADPQHRLGAGAALRSGAGAAGQRLRAGRGGGGGAVAAAAELDRGRLRCGGHRALREEHRPSVFVGLCFLYLAVFGQWDSAMVTLASILIAVPLGVGGGLLLGIAGYRWPWFDRLLTPVRSEEHTSE